MQPQQITSTPSAPPPPSSLPTLKPGQLTLSQAQVQLGCDPEFFFEQEGKIIGAEKVISKPLVSANGSTKIVLDGVQVELNPNPGYCRETLAGEIGTAFRNLRTHLASMPSIKANFTAVINVDQKELDALSDAAKALGCAPSLSRGTKSTIKVDGSKVTTRSAGGHIHLGLRNPLMFHRERLVDLLDILLGSTCVLIDRDPNAAERRKLYGQAGEYRLPPHGLEYRTLSNFWLRSYPLMSFVMGTARYAASILQTTLRAEQQRSYAKQVQAQHRGSNLDAYLQYAWDPEAELLDLVGGANGLKMIRKGINANDLDSAWETWEKVKPFIRLHSKGGTGLFADMLDNFDRFAKIVQEKGIETFFPDDPMQHWTTIHSPRGSGWENFITSPIRFKK